MRHGIVSSRWVALALLAFTARAAFALPPGNIERGKYLMDSVVACGNCHTQRGPQGEPLMDKGLSGGMVFEEKMFRAVAPNITPDPETGIGKWTDDQLAKAIREGIRPDGSVIGPPMPIGFYRHISDTDLAAIVAYLRAQPPVKHAVEKSKFNMPLPASYGPPVKSVKAPPAGRTVAYGKYLTDIGHCMDCHTPRDDKGMLVKGKVGAGGQVFPGPWGESVSRNLTPDATGLKGWTDEQIAHSIRTGTNREGQPYKPPMAFDWYRNIGDDDMAAIVKYLKSLKPIKMGG
ncbi:MAG TPA: c-type cytochrome [Ramlibacter sp.]|uniref:c-type cytochrome n=1 Tax=Ramlibacter sp. TaxID=1917967 RepID=UPI002C424865|nr:c-type cytochrome [Ramlibacter sp.]HVZ46342.1 c-type cytochrome [Ramlibacter sp.]